MVQYTLPTVWRTASDKLITITDIIELLWARRYDSAGVEPQTLFFIDVISRSGETWIDVLAVASELSFYTHPIVW